MKTQSRKILPLAPALAALGLHLSAPQPARAADFVSTSAMNRARSYHSATLLPNGKVLVAGGYGSTVTELFDPATGTWTQTGRLRAARSGQTATLLPNGKVLVTGGYGSDGQVGGVSGSAELYDPATGTWNFTASMRSIRARHTATLLPNGKVLVAGGHRDQSGLCCYSISSAELYDPASGTWSLTGAMRGARDTHTATLLPNGKVLVAGGYNNSGDSGPRAELYDPLTGTWTATGALSGNYVYDHTATLLPNGKVLIAGGCPCRDIQGDNPEAEVYDSASGTWTPAGPMITGRGLHAARLLPNGKVLVVGGYGGGNGARAELYDPAAGTWTATATMSYARNWHTATLLPNGNVLVAGGNSTSGSTSSAEIYEANSDGAAPSMTILHHTNDVMSFSWTGAGTLEQSDSLAAPNWQAAPIQDNPLTIGITGPMKFFRLRFNQ